MDKQARRKRGEDILTTMFGGVPEVPEATREMMDITVEHLFGDIWSRPGLAVRDRSMVTVAVLAALGRDQQLQLHMRGALNLGITQDELKELLIHVAHYSGWPTGMAGLSTLQRVTNPVE
jgi:4-carboxymuconolactone decarboxylase